MNGLPGRCTRAYRVFLTRNSEYHVRNGTCIGVRDRRTGAWCGEHVALGCPLSDSYVDVRGTIQTSTVPMIGDPLTFVVGGRRLQTSAILSIENREAAPGGPLGRYERAFSRRPGLSPRETH